MLEGRCKRCGEIFEYPYDKGRKVMYCLPCKIEKRKEYYKGKKKKEDRINLYKALKFMLTFEIISKWRYKRILKKIDKTFGGV